MRDPIRWFKCKLKPPKNLDWERTGYDKNKWEDVVKAFGEEFKPCQTVMQSWYQLGNLYSSHCKDQTEFMTRIKELAKEGGGVHQPGRDH